MTDNQHHSLFDKLAIRQRPDTQKQTIAQLIIDEVTAKKEYRSQIILAGIIATLWLLTNATAVVIGAMLIAPIMRPIQAASFAVSTGNRKLFGQALKLLIGSIAWCIAVAIVLTFLIPFTHITPEIAARIQPTFLDLIIAFASGLIAFLALGYEKIASSLAGVAMAASLVPPLCVIGIGIGLRDRQVARGSSLLFLTNLITIIAAGIFIFIWFGFFPTVKKNLHGGVIRGSGIILVLIAICFPLISSFFTISRDRQTQKIITDTVTQFIQQINPTITIQELDYQRLLTDKDTSIDITLTIPQDTTITNDQKTALSQKLATQLGGSVDLTLAVIPLVTVTQAIQATPSIPQQLQQLTNDFFLTYTGAEIYPLDSNYYDHNQTALISLYTLTPLTQQRTIENSFTQHLQQNLSWLQHILLQRTTNTTTPSQTDDQSPVTTSWYKLVPTDNDFS